MNRNERARALLRNDSPDLNMRPALGALVNKIENMSFVKDQPEVYEWLIYQLTWRYTRRFNRIQGLERLIRTMHLLASQTPLPDPLNPEEFEHLTMFTSDDWAVKQAAERVGVGDSPQGDSEVQNAEILKTEKGENLVSSEDAPETPKLTPVNLRDPMLKRGAESIMLDHMYNAHMMECQCGREMADATAYVKHLRIRIWRFLAGDVAAES